MCGRPDMSPLLGGVRLSRPSRVAPAAAIEHVLLKQSEEALPGRIVAGRTYATHRSDHVAATQGMNELSASKVTAAVAVQNAAGRPTAACHRTTERGRGEPGFHPGVDRISDDAV